jgi:hypothetical protein
VKRDDKAHGLLSLQASYRFVSSGTQHVRGE